MDVETLAQRLSEFGILLNRLHQDIDLPLAEREQTLRETLQQVLWLFEADDISQFMDNSYQEGQLLHWLIGTEQRLLEESQQQVLLLQSILQNSSAGVAVVSGPELIFRLANRAYRSMLVHPRLDLIGRAYEQIWPLDPAFDSERAIRQVLEDGLSRQFERIEQRDASGLVHSFSLRICRLVWHGEPGALLLLHDTTQTERARQLALDIAEASHRQAEELDAIIMAMAEAVLIFDPSGQIVRANPAAIDLFGIDPVDMDHVELIDLLALRQRDGSPVDKDRLPSGRALHGETVTGQSLMFVDSQSKEHIVRVSASPLSIEQDINAVVTVWHDVTERESLLEQLEIEQSRMKTIIRNAPEAILVADEEGRLVLGNPAAEQLFGHALPYGEGVENLSLLGSRYPDGSPYDPRNLPLVCSALDGDSFDDIEILVTQSDGNVRHLLASTAPIVDRKGNLNGAVGVYQDITERIHAEEALRQQAERSQLLANLSRAFAEAGLNYDQLLDTVTRLIGQTFGDLCSLHLFNDDSSRYFTAAIYTGVPAIQDALSDTYVKGQRAASEQSARQILGSSQPAILKDIPLEQARPLIPSLPNEMITRLLPERINAVIVPLRVHGRWIGTLNLFRLSVGRHYTAEEAVYLQDLADRAALAIEDSRLFEREAQRAREMQALHTATAALLSTLDLETLFAQILEAARQAIPAAEQGALYIFSPDGGNLELHTSFGCDNPSALHQQLEPYAIRATDEKRSLLLDEIPPALSGAASSGASPDCSHASAILAPLMLPQRVVGALALLGLRPALFAPNDLRLLDSFAATATAALQNATLYAEVERLATTDVVTEQFNRRKFFELGELEMHRFRRFNNPLSAIMLDLDTFKEVNDTYGHGIGDQVLRAVAQRCRNNIRMIDILGRYGGDEFAILLPNADIDEAGEIAERIRQAIMLTPILPGRQNIYVSISLGVAQAAKDMLSLSVLLGQADEALYAAKQGGRNRVVHAE